ncbi:Putative NADH:flavin oxidoreductase/NADH oxidase, aldolase-type TIM barrel [Septoria linicola]|uniref:NADH:flavin oxidoreductase/NADH oxidase, aldolase-type TIM barrel n=1 Tax=Septoria linicola TaxID=215465 RepID=A0A9Q9APR3_9PEZI|nr:Putative NADH:flavin oxidoreductase/NADH oxidase, aldolase-type TIM barrel [Septoria linicola]
MSSPVFQPFVLPNGAKLKNRIIKAAMEGQMSKWAQGGSSLVLSGHIMIDPRALACPGDVLLAEDGPGHNDERWRKWAQAAKSNNTQFWLQINHPGRQVKKGSELPTYAPSPVAIDIGKFSSFFKPPREMSEDQILDVIQRFRWAAKKAEEVGIDGVEIHAAHGYLISQFLSPKSNKRTDQWGGSRENRSRLLFEVIKAIRGAVSPSFGVGVKIFQRGGFDSEDLKWTVQRLNDMQLDFIELSGGNAESPAMRGAKQEGDKRSDRTIAREAYFLEAAEELKTIAKVPLVVTGGITTIETANAVVSSSENVLAGLGTALGMIPDLPNRWAAGERPVLHLPQSWILPGVLQFAASTACVQWNLHSIGQGNATRPGVWPVIAFLWSFLAEKKQMDQYKKWIGVLLGKPLKEA